MHRARESAAPPSPTLPFPYCDAHNTHLQVVQVHASGGGGGTRSDAGWRLHTHGVEAIQSQPLLMGGQQDDREGRAPRRKCRHEWRRCKPLVSVFLRRQSCSNSTDTHAPKWNAPLPSLRRAGRRSSAGKRQCMRGPHRWRGQWPLARSGPSAESPRRCAPAPPRQRATQTMRRRAAQSVSEWWCMEYKGRCTVLAEIFSPMIHTYVYCAPCFLEWLICGLFLWRIGEGKSQAEHAACK